MAIRLDQIEINGAVHRTDFLAILSTVFGEAQDLTRKDG